MVEIFPTIKGIDLTARGKSESERRLIRAVASRSTRLRAVGSRARNAQHELSKWPSFQESVSPRGLENKLLYRAQEEEFMLHWSLIFFVIALIAGALGFTGIAGAAAGIAKILFVVFLVVWLVIFLAVRKAV
jgi:uncharacterized membrane protein YtjA (UPF0391 family)